MLMEKARPLIVRKYCPAWFRMTHLQGQEGRVPQFGGIARSAERTLTRCSSLDRDVNPLRVCVRSGQAQSGL